MFQFSKPSNRKRQLLGLTPILLAFLLFFLFPASKISSQAKDVRDTIAGVLVFGTIAISTLLELVSAARGKVQPPAFSEDDERTQLFTQQATRRAYIFLLTLVAALGFLFIFIIPDRTFSGGDVGGLFFILEFLMIILYVVYFRLYERRKR